MNKDSPLLLIALVKSWFLALPTVCWPTLLLFWLCVVFCWALISVRLSCGFSKGPVASPPGNVSTSDLHSLCYPVLPGRNPVAPLDTGLSRTLQASIHKNKMASFREEGKQGKGEAGEIPFQDFGIWDQRDSKLWSLKLPMYLETVSQQPWCLCCLDIGGSVCKHHFSFKNTGHTAKKKNFF